MDESNESNVTSAHANLAACPGFAHNVFFLNHEHEESADARTLSHTNKWECEMVTAVALHLVRYAPSASHHQCWPVKLLTQQAEAGSLTG